MTRPRTSGGTGRKPTNASSASYNEQSTQTLSAQRANGQYDGEFDELTELEHEDVGVAREDATRRQERWQAPQTLAPAQEQDGGRTAAQPAPVFVPTAAQPMPQTGPPSGPQPAGQPLPGQQPGYGYAGPPAGGYPPSGGAFPIGPEAESMPSRAARAPRRARLTLRHLDPLSMLKFSLVLAAALFVVWMVAVGLLYGVLSGMGVFDKINSTANEINGSTGDVVTPGIVFGAAAVVGAVNIVLFTAFATIGSWIYNLCADMVGGLEVTLAERD